MISRKMKILDFHKISYILVPIDTVIVGVAGLYPFPIILYISISYRFRNLTVSRFVDDIINEPKVKCFTF